MTTTQTTPNKPFYKSRSIVMALLMVIVDILQHYGWLPGFMDATVIEGSVDQISGVVSGEYTPADFVKYLFGLLAVYFRATAKKAVENVKESVVKAPSRLVTWFKGIFKKKS